MTWKRAQRLEALIKEKVATVIVEHLSDPALGFVTVLRVELSDDKRIARIFYTVLGEPAVQRRTIRAIERAAPHVQERIAPSLRIRYMPQLRFVIDDSLEKEARLQKLLDQVSMERGEPGEEGAEGDDTPAVIAEDVADEGGDAPEPGPMPTPRSGSRPSSAADDEDDPFADDDLDG